MPDENYWESYYASIPLATKPSPFAKDMLKLVSAQRQKIEGLSLIELGCGNGRDSVFFSGLGLQVLALDQCPKVVAALNREHGSANLSFESADFTNLEASNNHYDIVYSRFTLHAVNAEGELRTLQWTSDALTKGGLFLVEVRTVNDDFFGIGEEVEPDAWVDTHYRRFVRTEEFCKRVLATGLEIVSFEEARGFAPYGDEDPVVLRLIARKP